jgi:hypothetical protein
LKQNLKSIGMMTSKCHRVGNCQTLMTASLLEFRSKLRGKGFKWFVRWTGAGKLESASWSFQASSNQTTDHRSKEIFLLSHVYACLLSTSFETKQKCKRTIESPVDLSELNIHLPWKVWRVTPIFEVTVNKWGVGARKEGQT